MSYYREQLETWLSELDVKADTVLDIGGKQNPVKGRTKSWDVGEYKVLDLPEWELNERWTQARLRDKGLNNSADMVFCLEVFEYLYEPVTALTSIHRVLKKGGVALVTFAFVYSHHNELEQDSLRYTESGVKRLANATNLEVDKIEYRVDRTGSLKKFYSLDGMRMAKEYHDHSVTGFICELKRTKQDTKELIKRINTEVVEWR